MGVARAADARDRRRDRGGHPEAAGIVIGIELTVNGARHEVDADPDTPLLYVLRNDLGLTATRFGCGEGACGACFVLVDGQAVTSCDLPLWSVTEASIVTVEGLGGFGAGLADSAGLAGAAGAAGALQEAFWEEQAAQCGYCISGMLISATALLAQTPAPDEQEVRSALDRNLCRCGSHNRIVSAVLRAAGGSEAAAGAAGAAGA